MAGTKGRSGGKRPGAGRPASNGRPKAKTARICPHCKRALRVPQRVATQKVQIIDQMFLAALRGNVSAILACWRLLNPSKRVRSTADAWSEQNHRTHNRR